MEKRLRRLYQTVQEGRNNCRFDDIARLLEALGYVPRAAGSSHHVFRRPGSPPLSIPFKRPVKRVYVDQVLAAVASIIPEIEDEHDDDED